MKKKKMVTTDVKKPPPVKKSPNGIGKKRGHPQKAVAGAKMGRPYVYDPDTPCDPKLAKNKKERNARY